MFGGYYTTENAIYQVLEIKDYNGNPVGTSNYGFMDYISNLDQVWDLRGESEGKYIGTMNKDVLPYYKGAYVVGLSSGSGKCDLNTGYGFVSDCRVLEPSQAPENDGDIYNRYFVVQESIYSKPKAIGESMLDGGKVKYDNSISKKTIGDNPNKEDYKKLLDSNVPSELHSKMEKLVKEQLKLDDSHFEVSLTQLQKFLSLIQGELRNEFDKTEFVQFGQFKFDANTGITDHLTDEKDWNVRKEDGKHGLFYVDGETKGLFDSNCASFGKFLFNEFSKDHSKIKDFDGDLDTREYGYILKRVIGKD